MACHHCQSGRAVLIDGTLHVQDSSLTDGSADRRCRHCKDSYVALPRGAFDELVRGAQPATEVHLGVAAFGEPSRVPGHNGIEVRVARGMEAFDYRQSWWTPDAAAAVVGHFFPGLVPEGLEEGENEDGQRSEQHGIAWDLPDNEWASVSVDVLEVLAGTWVVVSTSVYAEHHDPADEAFCS